MLFLWLLFPISVVAWGRDGHFITGQLASSFISEKTQAYLQDTLPPPYKDGDLGRVCLWADEIKGNRRYNHKISSLHYVDPRDCDYSSTRDCPSGWCLTKALQNLTLSLEGNAGGLTKEKTGLIPEWTFSHPGKGRKLIGLEETMAIRLVVHFIGDMHQPLHVCGIARGGNDISLVFDGHRMNMHSLWDHGLLSRRLLDFETTQAYVDFLFNLDVLVSDVSEEELARETARLNCNVVWKGVHRNGRHATLPEGYYEKAAPILDSQLKKAGVRMARLLDRTLGV